MRGEGWEGGKIVGEKGGKVRERMEVGGGSRMEVYLGLSKSINQRDKHNTFSLRVGWHMV